VVTVGKNDDYNQVNGNRPLVALKKMGAKDRKLVMGAEIGTQFDAYTRLFASFGLGDVFEVTDWKSRDLDMMLRRDGDASMVEQALTLPVRSTTYSLTEGKGDTGERELCERMIFAPPEAGGFHPGMDVIIGQMSEACAYRKAFFEKHFIQDTDDTIVMDSLLWRPSSTCDIRRDEHTAKFDGFRQRAWWYATSPGKQKFEQAYGKNFTGFLDIPKVRSFVLIHGQNRAPLVGTSDLDVTYWAYKQKQKILFLWFQFLETQSLPKLAVYGSDQDQANQNASSLSQMKASAVAGFLRPPPGQKLFDVIASSGEGAAQFQSAIQFLSAYQTNSCMAGFLSLGSAASLGRGSYALAESASQFFLQSREAFVKEICAQFTYQVLAPICILNTGAEAVVPKLVAAPLTEADATAVTTALTAMSVAPSLTIPHEYLLLVAEKAAEVFDLPMDKVKALLTSSAAMAQAKAADTSALGASPLGQGAAKIAGATSAASQIASSMGSIGNGRPGEPSV
jgi:hypothetical protein